MQITWKNFLISMSLLLVAVVLFSSIDVGRTSAAAAAEATALKVTVCDLDGKAVHNAEIVFLGENKSFRTDNKGLSPTMETVARENPLDPSLDWFCVNLLIKKEGYVDTFVWNCVLHVGKTRKLSVKIYPQDASDLPYVCYVESPPDDYLKTLRQSAG